MCTIQHPSNRAEHLFRNDLVVNVFNFHGHIECLTFKSARVPWGDLFNEFHQLFVRICIHSGVSLDCLGDAYNFNPFALYNFANYRKRPQFVLK